MKKNILLSSLIFFLTAPFLSVNSLDQSYPTVGGQSLLGNPTLEQYISYIYYFVISISGLIAFGIMVYAGFLYVTSTGMPERITEAKSRIMAAILGLVIIFCSWLIFNTINPQIASLQVIAPAATFPDFPRGVVICKSASVDIQGLLTDWTSYKVALDSLQSASSIDAKKSVNEQILGIVKEAMPIVNTLNGGDCYSMPEAGSVPADFANSPYYCYIPTDEEIQNNQPSQAKERGIIIDYMRHHATLNQNITDENYILANTSTSTGAACQRIQETQITKITPFTSIDSCDGCKVTVYERENFNEGIQSQCTSTGGQGDAIDQNPGIDQGLFGGQSSGSQVARCETITLGSNPFQSATIGGWSPRSIKFDPPGKFIALLMEGSTSDIGNGTSVAGMLALTGDQSNLLKFDQLTRWTPEACNANVQAQQDQNSKTNANGTRICASPTTGSVMLIQAMTY